MKKVSVFLFVSILASFGFAQEAKNKCDANAVKAALKVANRTYSNEETAVSFVEITERQLLRSRTPLMKYGVSLQQCSKTKHSDCHELAYEVIVAAESCKVLTVDLVGEE